VYSILDKVRILSSKYFVSFFKTYIDEQSVFFLDENNEMRVNLNSKLQANLSILTTESLSLFHLQQHYTKQLLYYLGFDKVIIERLIRGECINHQDVIMPEAIQFFCYALFDISQYYLKLRTDVKSILKSMVLLSRLNYITFFRWKNKPKVKIKEIDVEDCYQCLNDETVDHGFVSSRFRIFFQFSSVFKKELGIKLQIVDRSIKVLRRGAFVYRSELRKGIVDKLINVFHLVPTLVEEFDIHEVLFLRIFLNLMLFLILL